MVLRIKLEEDCLLYADEDFVLDGTIPVKQEIPESQLIAEAENVWKKWQTGCIVRKDGIPADWIKDIEYPRLGNLDTSTKIHKDTFADCELYGWWYDAIVLKKEPGPLLKTFQKLHGRQSLSQKEPATKDGLSEISIKEVNKCKQSIFKPCIYQSSI